MTVEEQVLSALDAYAGDYPSLQMILKEEEQEALKDIRTIIQEYPRLHPIVAVILVTQAIENFENYILYGKEN